MRKVPIELYRYQREWPTQRTVARFLTVALVVLGVLIVETLWRLWG